MFDKPDHSEQNTPDEQYLQFYNLDSYLFDSVHQRFANQGYLGAFDFFCIVIWKANRAKSKVAKKLLGKSMKKTLDEAVIELTKGVAAEETPKRKLLFLRFGKIPFRLPMATAILTVLYPDEFTVYDYRVCEVLDGFHNLNNITRIDKLWEEYLAFKRAVESNSPQGYSLRDRDRYLWGKSFSHQLQTDITNGFNSASDEDESRNVDAP